MRKRIKISKFLSYILRHNPYQFGLQLDKYGFADLDQVLKVVKKKFPLNKSQLEELVYTDKQARFQIKEGRIRACYGHSINVQPLSDTGNIPPTLYHGTSRKNLNSILKEGLKPMKRKFVHLSLTVEDAKRVGKRKDFLPVILKIDTEKAKREGIKFWREKTVVVASYIPSDCISPINSQGVNLWEEDN